MIEAILPVLQRWVLFGGVLLLVGVGVWRAVVVPRLHPLLDDGPDGSDASPPIGVVQAIEGLERRAARTAVRITLVLLAAWGLRLYTQLMGFRDPFAPLMDDLGFLVTGTFWGSVWMAQGGLLLVLTALFLVQSKRGSILAEGAPPGALTRGWKLAAWGIAALVLTLSLSSHAMSVPFNRPLAVAVDASHMAAAGGWIGVLALILILNRRRERHPGLFAAQLHRFSPLAMVCVGVLVFMGVILASVHLGAVSDLWTSAYGRVLSAKVLLALCVMGMGAWNWRRGLPVLGSEAGRRSVYRRATLEVGLAGAVLLLTAVLVGSSPPGSGH